jgi:hypothetical protein
MKVFRLSVALGLIFLFSLMPAAEAGSWWIFGTVQGNHLQDRVITVKLVRRGYSRENYVALTSTNKFGQYAFSNPGEGLPPSAYELVFYVGSARVTAIDLDGVRIGGRVPPVVINW